MERRELFKIIGIGAGAGVIAGPAAAQQHQHALPVTAAAATAAKAPSFFNAAQIAVLDRLSDIIIPSDEQSPGAHEAGVVRHLDLLAAHAAPGHQQQWRRGLEAVESAAQARFARAFADCTREQQEQIVALMAAHEGAPQNDLERFFGLLKPAVVDGYRFSEIGVRQYMGWVGNEFDTRTWRGACTHPEHQS